jgi:hypothetical protein
METETATAMVTIRLNSAMKSALMHTPVEREPQGRESAGSIQVPTVMSEELEAHHEHCCPTCK